MTLITQTTTPLIVSAQYCFANVLNGYCTFIDHIPMTFRTYTNSSCCLRLSQVYHLSNYNSIPWPSKNGSLVRSICGLNLAPVAAQICMCHTDPQCYKAYMCFSLWILHTVQVSYNYTRNCTLLAEALNNLH